jgi:hypothetical protein
MHSGPRPRVSVVKPKAPHALVTNADGEMLRAVDNNYPGT